MEEGPVTETVCLKNPKMMVNVYQSSLTVMCIRNVKFAGKNFLWGGPHHLWPTSMIRIMMIIVII